MMKREARLNSVALGLDGRLTIFLLHRDREEGGRSFPEGRGGDGTP